MNLTYNDAALLAAARALRIGGLRHPGGTVANYWSVTVRTSKLSRNSLQRESKKIATDLIDAVKWITNNALVELLVSSGKVSTTRLVEE